MNRSDNRSRMLAGELYDPADPELAAARLRARTLCQAIAALPAAAPKGERSALLEQLFEAATDADVVPPFFCDYGTNIALGRGVFLNVNCVVLDVARVTIGDRVLCGPAVQIYTATHPMSVEGRRSGLELAKPVRIGNDVWIGGGAIVCPGVSIGDGVVVGAGSVVVADLPGGVLAVGNPARVVRTI